jgi:hypothetical protein
MDGTRDSRDIHHALAPLGHWPDDVHLVVDLMQGPAITAQIKAFDLPGQE